MKIISRASTVGVAAAAAMAFLAPAAHAEHTSSKGQLRVCVYGLDAGDEAAVDISGRARWSGDIHGCKTFRAPTGTYDVDIDEPSGYDIRSGDDDRTVKVYSGKRTTVRFYLDDNGGSDDGYSDRRYDDSRDDDGYDSRDYSDRDYSDRDYTDDRNGHTIRFVRVDPGEDCPPGFERSRVNEEICVRD